LASTIDFQQEEKKRERERERARAQSYAFHMGAFRRCYRSKAALRVALGRKGRGREGMPSRQCRPLRAKCFPRRSSNEVSSIFFRPKLEGGKEGREEGRRMKGVCQNLLI